MPPKKSGAAKKASAKKPKLSVETKEIKSTTPYLSAEERAELQEDLAKIEKEVQEDREDLAQLESDLRKIVSIISTTTRELIEDEIDELRVSIKNDEAEIAEIRKQL